MVRPMSTWLPIIKRRGVSVLFQSYINHGYKDAYYEEILGVPRGLGSHRYVDGWVIVHTEEADAFTSKFIPRLDEPDYVDYFLRKCAQVADDVLAVGAEMREKPHASTDNSNLLFDFMRLSSASIRVMPFLNTMVFVQDAIEERVLQALSAHHRLDADDPDLQARMQSLMSGGSQVPLASQAMADLSSLAQRIDADHAGLAKRLQVAPGEVTEGEVADESSELESAFASYLDAYDFLGTNYYLGAPTSFTDLCRQLSGFMHKAPQARVAEATPDASDLREADRMLLATAQRLQYLREYRLEALYKAGRDCRGLLLSIGEALGTSYEETVHMTFGEIQASLTSQELAADLATINARMTEYASCVEDGESVFVVGAALESLRDALPEQAPTGDSLSGVTAYPGECAGPARIVTDLSQAEHVQAGDVLVAPMTMPYHVPAMARSVAVITDEGGILSHAAIVARELQIPCVVGLLSATTAFRDGEQLSVHARPSGGVVERVTI
jgi:phosphohistidine swiveling domain-containing protein